MAGDVDAIEAGKAAWLRIQERSKSTFSDWLEIGRMLIAARALCMRRANCNSPYGPAYQRFMKEWIEENGLQDIDNHERYASIVMVENLAEIEAWRSKLSDVEIRRCNHPNSVLRHWRKNTRPTRSGPKTHKAAHASRNGPKPSQDMVRVFAAMLRKAWSPDTYLMSSAVLQHMREHREEFIEFLNTDHSAPSSAVRRAAVVDETARAIA